MIVGLASGLFALSGVAVGSLSTHWFSRAREREARLDHKKSEDVTLRRTRGEELYTLTNAWIGAIEANYFCNYSAMLGKMTLNQVNDAMIERGKPSYDFSRIEMLVDVYFDGCRGTYDKLIQQRTQINNHVASYQQAYRRDRLEGERWEGVEIFVQCQQEFERAADAFRGEIKKRIKELAF